MGGSSRQPRTGPLPRFRTAGSWRRAAGPARALCHRIQHGDRADATRTRLGGRAAAVGPRPTDGGTRDRGHRRGPRRSPAQRGAGRWTYGRNPCPLRQDPPLRPRQRGRRLSGRRRGCGGRLGRAPDLSAHLLRPPVPGGVPAGARQGRHAVRRDRLVAGPTRPALAHAPAGPGDREPGVRPRREPLWHRPDRWVLRPIVSGESPWCGCGGRRGDSGDAASHGRPGTGDPVADGVRSHAIGAGPCLDFTTLPRSVPPCACVGWAGSWGFWDCPG